MTLDADVPEQLYSLQKWFGKVVSLPMGCLDSCGLPILDKALAKQALLHITDGPNLNAKQRVAIYNQQYWFRVFTIMQQSFPLVIRLIGYDDFNDMIEKYLDKYPPLHWSYDDMSQRFPRWIDEDYNGPKKELIYEASLLDEAYDRLFYLGVLPKIDKIEEEHLQDKKIYLQKTMAVFSFHADLLDYRKTLLDANVEYYQENPLPDLKWGETHCFVLYKRNNIFSFDAITEYEYHILKAFEKGATLPDAIDTLFKSCDPSEIGDMIQVWFANWIKKGFLTFDVNNP